MPHRVVLLIYRKPGMNPEAFKEYYEGTHVPLMQSLAGSRFPIAHTRRYIKRVSTQAAGGDLSLPATVYPAAVLSGKQEDFEFDAIAEMVFEDEAACQRLLAFFARPDIAEKVAADCQNFLDISKSPVVLLEDCITTGRITA